MDSGIVIFLPNVLKIRLRVAKPYLSVKPHALLLNRILYLYADHHETVRISRLLRHPLEFDIVVIGSSSPPC